MKNLLPKVAPGLGLVAALGLLAACGTSAPAAQPAAPTAQQSATAQQPVAGQSVAPAGQAPADSFGARSAENGYWPKSVQLGLDRTLGSVLIDGEGFTLYRFEKDSAAPPKATCVGECGRVWPPVLVNEKITFRNLDAGLIGAVTRQDGTQQLTVAGHPAYRYVEDAVPGQTNGQAVDGAWFVLGPDGGRAGAQQPAP